MYYTDCIQNLYNYYSWNRVYQGGAIMKFKFSKKLLTVGAVALMVVGGLAGCGAKNNTAYNKIKSEKTFSMGTSADFAPFEFPVVKNGKKTYNGFDIMVANQIAKDMGVKLKVQNMQFSSLIGELQNNKVQMVMAGMTATKQRRKAVDFSKPYYTESEALLVKKSDANKYTTKDSTKGASFGAQQGSIQENVGKSQTKAHMVSEGLVTSLTTELKSGKLDGVVLAQKVAEEYVKKYPNDYAIAPVKLPVPKSQREICIALPKNEPKLKKKVNAEITKMQKNGQLDKMFQQAQQLQEQSGK